MCVCRPSVCIVLHLCVQSFETFQSLIHQWMLHLGAGEKLRRQAFKLIHVEFQSFPHQTLIRPYLMKYLYMESSCHVALTLRCDHRTNINNNKMINLIFDVSFSVTVLGRETRQHMKSLCSNKVTLTLSVMNVWLLILQNITDHLSSGCKLQGSQGELNKTWAPLKTWFVKFWVGL